MSKIQKYMEVNATTTKSLTRTILETLLINIDQFVETKNTEFLTTVNVLSNAVILNLNKNIPGDELASIISIFVSLSTLSTLQDNTDFTPEFFNELKMIRAGLQAMKNSI